MLTHSGIAPLADSLGEGEASQKQLSCFVFLSAHLGVLPGRMLLKQGFSAFDLTHLMGPTVREVQVCPPFFATSNVRAWFRKVCHMRKPMGGRGRGGGGERGGRGRGEGASVVELSTWAIKKGKGLRNHECVCRSLRF